MKLAMEIAARCRISLMTSLFHKIINLTSFSIKEANLGKLINLTSNDLNSVEVKL